MRASNLRYSFVKMMRVLRRLSLLILLCISFQARTADTAGNFAAKGVATVSCEEFVAAVKQGGRLSLGEYVGYVAGYTSAYNEMTPTTFDAWPWQTIDTAMLVLLERCEKTPSLNFGTAVARLTRYFAATGIPANEKTRLIGNEEKGFYLYESTYKALLKALAREGYQTDDPYAALMRYKTDKNVAVKANIHQVLLLRLIGAGTTVPASAEQ